MPRMFIPFGQMAPDAGMFGNGSLTTASDVVPVFGGYATAPTWSQSSVLRSAAPVNLTAGAPLFGFHVHTNSSRQPRFFVATDSKIFLRDITSSVSGDVSRTIVAPATQAYTTNLTTTDGYGGQFYSFGIYTIFTNGNDAIQFRSGDVDTVGPVPPNPASSIFTEMVNTTTVDGATLIQPRAQFVSSIKNHLVIANCDLTAGADTNGVICGGAFDTLLAQRYPELVWWSATDNVTRFGSEGITPSLIGTGYQPLYDDYGHITGLAGGEDLYVFKERCIYRMSGPPFTFELISGAVGTTFPNSIVRQGNDIYFWGYDGPYVISGGQVRSLSNGKLDMWLAGLGRSLAILLGNRDRPDFRFVQGAISQTSDCVVWNFSQQTVDATAPYDELFRYTYSVIYNKVTDTFSTVSFVTDYDLSDWQVYGPKQLDPQVLLKYRNSSVLLFPDMAMFGSQNALFDDIMINGLDTNIQATPNFITGFVQIDQGASTVIRRVRLVTTVRKVAGPGGAYPDGLPVNYSVSIKSKNAPHGPYLEENDFTGPFSGIDSEGWIRISQGSAADFHSFSVSAAAGDNTTILKTSNILKFHGIEVEYERVGVRSKPYA